MFRGFAVRVVLSLRAYRNRHDELSEVRDFVIQCQAIAKRVSCIINHLISQGVYLMVKFFSELQSIPSSTSLFEDTTVPLISVDVSLVASDFLRLA